MGREWKPGDVAAIECSDGEWRQAAYFEPTFDQPCWVFADNGRRRVNESKFRPLVVIDPEDREAVKRLADLIPNCGDPENHCDPQQCMSMSCWIDRVQAALREFANPKPPKPEEPTGLGAVVADADGYKYVRIHVRDDITYSWWVMDESANKSQVMWKFVDIDVVRVLSEGVVQP